MDSLSMEKQADIRKMSTARLTTRLIKAGYDEEVVSGMERDELMEEWAACVLSGKDQPSPAVSEIVTRPTVAMADPELQRQWLALEQQRLQMKQQEMDFLARKEKEKQKMKMEQLRAEQEIKNKEILLREQEIEILARKNKEEKKNRDKLPSQMKYYHAAMKSSFSKFPHDPAELPAFFDHVENLFSLYEVPDSLRGPLLQAHLSDKAKALVIRLTRAQMDDYCLPKYFLLNK